MDSIRSLKFSCLAFVVVVALSGQAFSSTVAVGNCTKLVQFATIQLAVNAVPSGSTVKVCSGTYPEQVTIANKNLTLIGVGPTASTVTVPASGLVTNGVTDIFGFPTAAQIFVQNATVTISHMAVDGANDQLTGCGVDAVGIYFKNAAGVITDNAVRNVLLPPGLQGCQDGLAINVESSTATAVTISNNSVRNYDKNGITASGPSGPNGPKVTITGNTVVGLGATTVIAQNGIQIGYGASGSIQNNYVADDIYLNPPDCASSNSCYGSSGILIWASHGIAVSGNTVESTQYGIVPVSWQPDGSDSDQTVIANNHIGGTQLFDAIDVCSNNNGIQKNVIYGSSQDAIHLDDSCSPSLSYAASGSGNNVTGNTINEGCAGVLQGPLTASNSIPLSGVNTNTLMNVDNLVLGADSCSPTLAPDASAKMSGTSAKHLRPSPLKPNRD
jgi:hypothetical protein